MFDLFLPPGHKFRPGVTASIQLGVVPEGSYPGRIPWLAFASSTFLKTNLDFPAPWADTLEPSAHIHEVRRKDSTNYSDVTETIEWVVSNKKLQGLSTNSWLDYYPELYKKSVSTWRPNEMSGFLSASYVVVAFTNIADTTLPLQFELRKFRSSLAPAGITNFEIASLFIGKVRKVRVLPPSSLLPQLPTNEAIYILDHRFQDRQAGLLAIHYTITNRPWPIDVSDPNLQQTLIIQAREKIRQDRLRRIFGPQVNRITMAVIVLAAALVFAWWFVRHGQDE